ncbi:MAG TPA: hypothetical protein VN408_33890 [Actinoplanes sp.]|nr:hypothetical protein [Actinoplanes sp.]
MRDGALRWLPMVLAVLTAGVLLPAPAAGAPGGGSATAEEKGDGDLSTVIEATSRRYVAAKGAVAASRKKQRTLTAQLTAAEARRDALIPEVGEIARQQYQIGDLGTLGYLLSAGSSDDFMAKAASLEEINRLHDGTLRELDRAVRTVADRTQRIGAELKREQQQLEVLRKQRETARGQLDLLGGGTGINSSISNGFVDATSKVAKPAPRDADGGFSAEGCTEKDETTSGCVTRRTLHMYKEARRAGFKLFAGCHRTGGPFEHPKGRACDWSLQKSGFAVAHNDAMVRYGNDLTAFLVRNADRLGIYYVIWYKQIWFTAEGKWRSYSGPSAHTDHVHVSMF